MKKLLHLIASPRGEASRTLQVAQAFLDSFRAAHPDWEVEGLDLFQADLPPVTGQVTGGKYALLAGGELDGEAAQAWRKVIPLIERFLSAEAWLLSVPMWNFGIPYVLKHYIDLVVQPRYLFRYTPNGPEGLLRGRRMVVVTSRGGDYSEGPGKAYDQLEPYLRTVFGFCGAAPLEFVNAQPMDAGGAETRDRRLAQAVAAAKALGAAF